MILIQQVSVLGCGVLGAQIAFQTAFNDFDVTVYDINEQAIEQGKQRMLAISVQFQKEMKVSRRLINAALSRLSYSSDLAGVVKQADLVIEAIPENIKIKQDAYTKLAKLAPEHAIFASNSSTLLPSAMVEFTGRPDRFLSLHFANHIWLHNIAEIMATSQTSPQVYQAVVEFARDIGMVPIEIKKEQPGYVLNSLLVPFLNAAGNLLKNGVAEPKTIDKTWQIATGAPLGPFQIFDIVGMQTVYNITAKADPSLASFIKENYLDKGKTKFLE